MRKMIAAMGVVLAPACLAAQAPSSAHRCYLAIEAAVSAAINATLSIAFVLLVFRGQARIAADALIWDALPQSFAVAFMATLVPALLAARRVGAGVIAPLPARASKRGQGQKQGRGRRHAPLPAALLTALAVTAVAVVAHGALLPLLLPVPASFGTVLIGKAIYGAVLGAGLTLVAVHRALAA